MCSRCRMYNKRLYICYICKQWEQLQLINKFLCFLCAALNQRILMFLELRELRSSGAIRGYIFYRRKSRQSLPALLWKGRINNKWYHFKLCGLEGGIITACQLTAAFKMPLDFWHFYYVLWFIFYTDFLCFFIFHFMQHILNHFLMFFWITEEKIRITCI